MTRLLDAANWLLGPVVFYELVHTTRRSHFVLYRLYAYFILVLLALFYFVWAVQQPSDSNGMTIPAASMSSFAGSFVFTFMRLQVLMLAVLTPAYTAGVLAGEKEAGTLEFLLATDLRNREIVLGKLVARLGNLLLILLTGLPVVGFLQFMGGVDSWLVLAGFAATGITMIGLAGLSILNSVYARKPRNAIVLTFLEAAAYLLVSILVPSVTVGMGFMGTRILGGFTLGDIFDWLEAGNPILMLITFARELASGIPVADCLPLRLRDYSLFHGVLALICVVWASLRLRAVFRKQVYEQVRPMGGGWGRRRWRGASHWPMIWKEVFVEPGLRFNWFGWLVMAVLVVASFTPVGMYWQSPGAVPPAAFLGDWARIVGALVACLLLLRVAIHASTALTSERERQTLDGLLTTPLTGREILFGKWLGSVASVRWGWLWLGTVWGIGTGSGGLHPLAVLLLLAAWSIYAGVLAVVGLWFSLRAQTSLRATVLTLLAALGLGFSYALSMPLMMLGRYGIEPDSLLTRINRFQEALSPLLSLAWLLPFSLQPELDPWRFKQGWEMPTALVGLLCWLVGGVALWCVLCFLFQRRTGRQALRQPEREPVVERLAAEPVAAGAR